MYKYVAFMRIDDKHQKKLDHVKTAKYIFLFGRSIPISFKLIDMNLLSFQYLKVYFTLVNMYINTEK